MPLYSHGQGVVRHLILAATAGLDNHLGTKRDLLVHVINQVGLSTSRADFAGRPRVWADRLCTFAKSQMCKHRNPGNLGEFVLQIHRGRRAAGGRRCSNSLRLMRSLQFDFFLYHSTALVAMYQANDFSGLAAKMKR
jgi:hypothetical protein